MTLASYRSVLLLETVASLLFFGVGTAFGLLASSRKRYLPTEGNRSREQDNLLLKSLYASGRDIQAKADDATNPSYRSRDALLMESQHSRSTFLSASASTIFTAFALSSSAAATSPPQYYKPVSDSSLTLSSGTVGVEKDDEDSKTFEESISGFVAGAAVSASKTLIKYPLDTATVRLQMPETEYSVFRLGQLFDESFRGVWAPLVSNIPAGAVFFAVKDATKSSLRGSGLPKWLTTSLAVAVAQCPYWLVRNPSEIIKTRQQAGIDGYGEGITSLDAMRMARNESMAREGGTGIDAFYIGYWENILYAFPADVIKFVFYEFLTGGRKNLPPREGAVAGSVATAVAQFLTTPLDVVRNRVMADQNDLMAEPGTVSKSYLDRLRTLSKEGPQGLFAGSSAKFGKAILSGAIQFATYEETKQTLNNFFRAK